MRGEYTITRRLIRAMRPMGHDERTALARRVMRASVAGEDLQSLAAVVEGEQDEQRRHQNPRQDELLRLRAEIEESFNKASANTPPETQENTIAAEPNGTTQKELISEPPTDVAAAEEDGDTNITAGTMLLNPPKIEAPKPAENSRSLVGDEVLQRDLISQHDREATQAQD